MTIGPRGEHTGLRRVGWRGLVGIVLVWGVLVSAPQWIDIYNLFVLRDVLIFGLFALSLDFLWGKAGLLSFGHAAFFGVGAYTLSVVSMKLDPSYGSVLGLLAGVALSAAIAGVLGYFLLYGRVRGAVFAIVTLAVTLIATHIAVSWSEVTGGDTGLVGVPTLGIEVFGSRYALLDPSDQYLFALGLVSVSLLGLWLACRGRYGRVLAAIRDNEIRARTLGHNTSLHLLLVLVVSAMLAALAGGFYSGVQNYVALDLIGLALSTEVIVWVAVGGRGTLLGPLIGVFVIMTLKQEVSSIDYRAWPIVLGLFFILVVYVFPRGLISLGESLVRLLRRILPLPLWAVIGGNDGTDT